MLIAEQQPIYPYWDMGPLKVSSLESIPEEYFGFIYKITHIPTSKSYIGKKNFYTNRNVKLGKKELAQIKEDRKSEGMRGRPPSKKKVIKESDWVNYWGSNKPLLELIKIEGKHNFKREILELAKNKKHLTYLETKYLFKNNVLENNDKFFNDTILGRFYSKDFNLES